MQTLATSSITHDLVEVEPAAGERPVVLSKDGRPRRTPRLVGATSATLIALWLAAVVIGALGFYALPGLGVGILRPSVIAAKPQPAPHRAPAPHRTRLVRFAPVRVAAPLPAVATARVVVRPAVLVLRRPVHKIAHRGRAHAGRRRALKSHARSPHRRAHPVGSRRHATVQT